MPCQRRPRPSRARNRCGQFSVYCTVTAPISGHIGAALVTEGALVSQSAATEMAFRSRNWTRI